MSLQSSCREHKSDLSKKTLLNYLSSFNKRKSGYVQVKIDYASMLSQDPMKTYL